MIVRILGEGQYEVSDEALAPLNELDAELNAAMEAGEEERFDRALEAILDKVRDAGRELDLTTIVPSDLTVPHSGATLSEVRELLASEPDDSHSVTEGA